MKQQVKNYRPEEIAKWFNAEITSETVSNLSRFGFSSKITNGQFAIEFLIPYTRRCYDIYNAVTGQFIERCHSPQKAYYIFKNL